MDENSRTEPSAPAAKVKLYLPDASVSTPIVVPFTKTATPCSGLALMSATVPVTVILLSSAYALWEGTSSNENIITNAERLKTNSFFIL